MLNLDPDREPAWEAGAEPGKGKGRGNPGTPPQADSPLAHNAPKASTAGSAENKPTTPPHELGMGADLETALLLQVTTMFLVDPPTRMTFIEVNNDQGIVTLRGQVGSAEMSARVGEIVSRYPGVTGVINDLEIRSAEQNKAA